MPRAPSRPSMARTSAVARCASTKPRTSPAVAAAVVAASAAAAAVVVAVAAAAVVATAVVEAAAAGNTAADGWAHAGPFCLESFDGESELPARKAPEGNCAQAASG